MTKEYAQNKFINYYVGTLNDLKNIENLDDVPLRITITNDINVSVYEKEIEINKISELLDEYKILWKKYIKTGNIKYLEKAELVFNEMSKLYSSVREFYSEVPELNLKDTFTTERIKKILNDIKKEVICRFKPINLENRTSQIMIVGRSNTINGINIFHSNNAALFNNVNCDITINDLDISNICVQGNENIALLVCGKEDSTPNKLTLNGVRVHGQVIGNENVSELVTNYNGAIVFNKCELDIGVNTEERFNAIFNKEIVDVDNAYPSKKDYIINDKEYVRKRSL